MFGSFGKLLQKVFGSKQERDLKELYPIVHKINEEFSRLSTLSDDELRSKTSELKNIVHQQIAPITTEIESLKEKTRDPQISLEEKEKLFKTIDELKKEELKKIENILWEILPVAFAVVKETARRFKENGKLIVKATEWDRQLSVSKTNVKIEGDQAIWHNRWIAAGNEIVWDMVHYDVQLIGGIVIHQGKIAEMATGEGKTLVSTCPVYLNALAGKGVHVVTVNDYLAKRDCEWMGPLFEFHGLKVDCIDKYEPHSSGRKNAYLADITYGTNNEFGFDYLRDNMAFSVEDLVQRGHHYAIVDEVDSVLIDDARTPLIISGPTPQGNKHEYYQLKPLVEKLVNAQRRYVTTALADAKRLLTEENSSDSKDQKKRKEQGGLALLRAHRGLPKNKPLIKFLSEPGIKQILIETENYYLQDQAKEMPKVDAELYFVIDEKNNSVELTEKGIELISEGASDKNFFVIPDIATELSKIESENLSEQEKLKAKDKLIQEYQIKADRIHTIHQLLKAYTLFEKDVEYVIIDGKIKIVDEQTGRIMEGRRYSDGLHQAIEAKENVKVEAATQTYATITLQNFFRMYHKLAGMTGTAETEAGEFWEIYKLDVVVIPTHKPVIRKDYEDLVYKTKREKYKAVIDEIEKLIQQGRPVLVGTTSVEISEQLSRMLKMRNIRHNVLNAKLHAKEAEIVAEAGKAGTVTIATNMAGRGTDIKLGPGVKEAGGLAIIGTERHESRRVDRQLRGRAGRQGDPGTSQFFVSLEDDLMRLFGSERIAKLMDRMGIEEGEVIQHPMITRSIERAQKKVEENNFGIRKRLLEYDDVMNAQRTVIYEKRRNALFGDKIELDLENMISDLTYSLLEIYKDTNDYEGFSLEILRTFSIENPLPKEEWEKLSHNEIHHTLLNTIRQSLQRKRDILADMALPVLKNIYETQKGHIKNIVIPFSDGIKTVNTLVDLEETIQQEGKNLLTAFERSAMLGIIDLHWKEHLRELDDLKQSVQGAVYEQKDPLLIYKFEAFELFKQLLEKISREAVSFILRAQLPQPQEGQQKGQGPMPDFSSKSPVKQKLETNRGSMPSSPASLPSQREYYDPSSPKVAKTPLKVEKKINRNDPCPCGSGKKYKHCHGNA